MSSYQEACLTALSYYEATVEGNHVNIESIVRDSEPLEIVHGLTVLVGALIASCAAASGCTPAVMVETLRALYLSTAADA